VALRMAAATQPSRAGFNQGMLSSGLCLRLWRPLAQT
jgi:hypothetical protein